MKKYLCSNERGDGFGGQFQTYVCALLYAENNNYEYVHRKIVSMEHNYSNDEKFVEKMDNLMNLEGNYKNISDVDANEIHEINIVELYNLFESEIDRYLDKESEPMKKLKEIFWKNKNKNFFDNNKKNVAIHIRRPNPHDNRLLGTDTPNSYYLNVMNEIREKNNNENKKKELLFHIYSQGSIENFDCYKNDDVIFHIDEELTNTFIGMVASETIVSSCSSFSYAAAFLTDGDVIFPKNFWHRPKSDWICV